MVGGLDVVVELVLPVLVDVLDEVPGLAVDELVEEVGLLDELDDGGLEEVVVWGDVVLVVDDDAVSLSSSPAQPARPSASMDSAITDRARGGCLPMVISPPPGRGVAAPC